MGPSFTYVHPQNNTRKTDFPFRLLSIDDSNPAEIRHGNKLKRLHRGAPAADTVGLARGVATAAVNI